VEELKPFTVVYDGASRPDLVSRWQKLMLAVSDARALDELKRVLAPADLELVSSFQRRLVEDQEETDKLFVTMFRALCHEVHALDGGEIARRALNIDQAVADRRKSLTKSLLSSLSAKGAETVMQVAEEPAKRIGGSYTDVPAIAARYPEYVKDRYLQRCAGYMTTRG